MLDHIEVYVSNIKKSRIFYDFLMKELGWSLFQAWDKGFSYQFSHYYITFVQTEDDFLSKSYHRKNTGLNHLAFQLSSRKKVDELREKIKKHDITELYTDKYPFAGGSGYYALFFEDPDIIKIEVVVRKGSSVK